MMILVQGPLLSSVSKRFDKRSLVLFGSLTLIPGFMLLTRSDIPFLYLGVTVMALGNGLMWPSFLNILGSKGDVSIQGSIQGYGASMGSIARMTGLITGGILFEVWNTNLFFLAGGVFAVIFALAYKVCRT
jgi:MFS family permease